MSKSMSIADHDREYYQTPRHIVEALLARESFPGTIWEPAAGGGHIVHVLEDWGYTDILASDIHDWGCGYPTMDFLATDTITDSLVTNPPLSLKFEFLLHAKRVVRHKFALLLSAQVETTRTFARQHLCDRVFAWKARYAIVGPVPWVNAIRHGSLVRFAWYVFERGYEGPTRWELIDFEKPLPTPQRLRHDT